MGEVSIIASLTAPPSDDGRDLFAVAAAAEWLEVRADLVGDLDPIWLRRFFPGRLLYSLRSTAAGGAFTGTLAERTDRLQQASREYDLVELESETDLRPGLLDLIPAGRRMVSWYGGPSDSRELATRFRRLAAVESRIYKLVVDARRSGDELAPLCLLKSLGRSDVIAFASGELGFWSRLLAPRYGAPFIFGSAGRSWTDDGAPPVTQLIEDYGFPALFPVREIYGIVGNPVRHSLSPRLHNAAYREFGRPALFVPFAVDSFGEFWSEVAQSNQMKELGLELLGLTVVSPHKEAAISLAKSSSSMVQLASTTNIFVRNGGEWIADTTDPEGVVLALAGRGIEVRGKRAAVIGCGGAGRAIAAALVRDGADVTLVNRGPERGTFSSELLGLPFVPLLDFDPTGFSILVNATPVGRADDSAPFALGSLDGQTVVIDLVYKSGVTPLVAKALSVGGEAVDGLEVLLIQVRRQYHMMTGQDLPDGLARGLLDLPTQIPAFPYCDVIEAFRECEPAN